MGRLGLWGNNGMGAASPTEDLANRPTRSNASSDASSNNAALTDPTPASSAISSASDNNGDETNLAEGEGEATTSANGTSTAGGGDTSTYEEQQVVAGQSNGDPRQALRDMDAKCQANSFHQVDPTDLSHIGSHDSESPNRSLGLVARLNQMENRQAKERPTASEAEGKLKEVHTQAQQDSSTTNRVSLVSFFRHNSLAPMPEDQTETTRTSSTSQAPGAVAIFPEREYLSVRRDEEQGGISGEIPWQSGHSRDGLVEARALTTSKEFLEEAFQVPSSELQHPAPPQRTASKESGWRWWFLLALVVVAVCISVVLGLSLGLRQRDNSVSDTDILSPSIGPSVAPSYAPTGSMDLLLEDLPEYTLRSLETFGTPQWQAREWLVMHPDLPNLSFWRQKQLFALATFFFAFQGPHWRPEVRDNWLQYQVNECDWFSSRFGSFDKDGRFEASRHIAVEYPQGSPCNADGEFHNLRLIDLEIEISDSIPRIPPEIALLTSLESIELEGNHIQAGLSDCLPSQIYQMDSLRMLSLRSNQLSGTIPSQIAGLSTLKFLTLVRNSLTGSIPTQIGMLSNLVGLRLNDNMLSGSIPSQVGLIINMEYLGLWSNSLSGSIPKTLYALQDLELCFLDTNALTGTIATEIGLLAGSLRSLGLQVNLLSGSLPSELGLLKNVTQLATSFNPLLGTIPSEVGMMDSLKALDLSMSAFEGSIPSQLGLLSWLQESIPSNVDKLWGGGISLEGNSLVGTIPTQLALLGKLNALSLRNNPLTGPIPTEFGTLSFLDGLYLGETRLSGSIPSQFGTLQRLGVLELSKMPFLSGSVPQKLSNLSSMKVLRLDGSSQLSGTIPEILCSIESNGLCSLEYWWLQYRLDTKECALEFDCTNQLCGCDCPCSR